ncbi:MAG: hypothetical protein K2X27_07490 [Candidatus Obscuribacterales bacterium]|nr:hypothetical protein [Candidatus Obscuribacterales bacterium]
MNIDLRLNQLLSLLSRAVQNFRRSLGEHSAAIGQSPISVQQNLNSRAQNRRERNRSHYQGRNVSDPRSEGETMFDELISQSSKASEQDFRLMILNALLKTPHRQIAPYIPLFRFVHNKDPLFFGHLAAWYVDNGTVRDLKHLFVAFLATSTFSEEFRSAGLAILQNLAPYEVERVLSYIKGHKEDGNRVLGVANSVPRSVKTTIENYLREREANQETFDKVVLHARKPLKTLYASLRIRPGDYAQKVLFENKPPEDSRLYVLKLLAKTSDPLEQARLIVEHKVPYRVAISGLKQVTPSVLAALLCAMTPQEVINNLASLKKRGVMDNPDLRAVVEAKLNEAQSDKRVSALKTRQAIKAANLDAEMIKKVESVGDKQIKAKAKIKRPTALHIDKSGSMDIAIEVGKQIAAIIAPICEAGLFVYAFDTISYAIEAKGNGELSDWEKAFKGISAGGGTSCGAAVEAMRRKGQVVEQIIVVTDQEENNQPKMAPMLKQYAQEKGTMPNIVIVNVGRHSKVLENSLTEAGISVDTFDFNGDYYSLPSLLPMLAGGTRLEFLMDLMAYPLPERKTPALARA